jgi:hypothetical protein
VTAESTDNLRLRVPRVMHLSAFRQQALASTLAAARERRASAFGAHARTKTVLIFPGALGALQSAFHKRVLTETAGGPLH